MREPGSEPGSARGVRTGPVIPTPEGGWIRAEERARAEDRPRVQPYYNIACAYLTNNEVLPGTYGTCEEALQSHTLINTPSQEQSGSTEGVPAEQCCIALDENTNRLWVMLQATDASSVDYRNLGTKDQALFNKSRGVEVNNLLDLGAYRIMSLDDSLRFRTEFPEYVLPSRFVDRWKATDEGGAKARSRIVILGFKDPHVLQLVRSAPKPSRR